MSTLSGLFPVASTSPIKSIQKGDVNTTVSSGASPDLAFIDVTISAVNTAKSFVLVEGSFGSTAVIAGTYYGGQTSTPVSVAKARLTSSTNLRIYTNVSNSALSASWQVVECN